MEQPVLATEEELPDVIIELDDSGVPVIRPGDADVEPGVTKSMPPEEGPPRWPGWQHDIQLMKVYASKVKLAFAQSVAEAERLIASWWDGTYTGTRQGLVDDIRDILVTRLGQTLKNLWKEAWFLGDESAKAVIARTGVDWGEWEPGDPDAAMIVGSGARLQALLDSYGVQTIKSVANTNMDRLAEEVRKAVANGDSAGSLSRRLPQILNVPGRADMIARTEVARAVTAATMSRYTQTGISRKEWEVAPDERVCPTCHGNELAGSIPTTQAFPSGVMAPPGHPNCRCAIMPAEVAGIDLTDDSTLISDALLVKGPPKGLLPDTVKAGPKGYVHGWKYVGAPKTSLAEWEPHKQELLDLARGEKASEPFGGHREDRVLKRIAQLQGFDAKPSQGGIDPGGQSLYRGMPPEHAEQLLHGDYYAGAGTHGSGYYTTTRPERAGLYAAGEVTHDSGTSYEMQLHPDAKVADEDDMYDAAEKLPADWKEITGGDDPSRVAALLGYDAVKPHRGSTVLVLNRGALRVKPSEKTAAAQPGLVKEPAWMHELRGRHGEWAVSSDAAEPAQSKFDELSAPQDGQALRRRLKAATDDELRATVEDGNKRKAEHPEENPYKFDRTIGNAQGELDRRAKKKSKDEAKAEAARAEAKRIQDAEPDVNLDGVDPKLQPMIRQRLSHFKDRYPYASTKLQKVSMQPSAVFSKPDTTMADVVYLGDGNSEMRLNSKYFSDLKTLAHASYGSYRSKYHPVDSMMSVIDHELGHVVDNASAAGGSGRVSAADTWVNDARYISEYAEKNSREAFAEGFSLWEAMADDPSLSASDQWHLTADMKSQLSGLQSTDSRRYASKGTIVSDDYAPTCEGYVPPEFVPGEDAEKLAQPDVVKEPAWMHELRDSHGKWVKGLHSVDSTDLSMRKDGSVLHRESGKKLGTVIREPDTPRKGTTTFTVTHADGTQVYHGVYKREALAALAKHHNQAVSEIPAKKPEPEAKPASPPEIRHPEPAAKKPSSYSYGIDRVRPLSAAEMARRERILGAAPVKTAEPPVKPAPVADDPPAWLQDAFNQASALDDEIEKERNPSGPLGFTARGEELRREKSKILDGDIWAAEDDPDRYGAIDKARRQGVSKSTIRRGMLLASNKQHRAHLSAENGLSPEEGDRQMTDELKRALAGRRVAIRVTNTNLAKILADGNFRTQFETNRSKGLKSNEVRAQLEATQFGYPEDMDPSLRPVYAYMDDGFDRPAGTGSKYLGDFGTDDLSMFGTTQVVMKDSVKDRATFNIGDSMDNQYASLPSRVSDPKPYSYAAFGSRDGGMANPGVLKSMNRDYSGGKFRSQSFIEAQVHSPDGAQRPMTTADIDHVVFPATPPPALRSQLEAGGIPWSVVNAKTIAKAGNADSKVRVLVMYQQDLAQAEDRLQWLKSYGEQYREKYGKEWSGTEDIADITKKADAIRDNIRLLESAK